MLIPALPVVNCFQIAQHYLLLDHYVGEDGDDYDYDAEYDNDDDEVIVKTMQAMGYCLTNQVI